MAVSYSFANILNALLLLWLLDRKVTFEKKQIIVPAAKMIFIAILTAVALYVPMKLLDQLVFDTTRTIGLLLLTGIATLVGVGVYLFLSYLLKVEQIFIFYSFGKRIMSFPSRLVNPPPTSIDAQQPNP